MYLYRKPIPASGSKEVPFPETMQVRCVLRNRERLRIPPDRMECPVVEIYSRGGLPVEKPGHFSYPLFCEKDLFGMLVCGADDGSFEIGKLPTFRFSRSIFIYEMDQYPP